MSGTLSKRDWNLLLGRIRDGHCTPFLGAGACYGVLPLGGEIAERWAEASGYPLEDRWNLARVAQYRAVIEDPMSPKEALVREFRQAAPPDFREPDEPHAALAGLPLPIYLTTNYDDFMIRALKSARKEPKRELCRWNSYLEDLPSAFDGDFEPTVAMPVVYHLHGHMGHPESLVLTEDDYLDFLVNLGKDEGRDVREQKFLPPRIQRALTGASLLFLGYSIGDWDFRVLFRSLVGYLERSITRAHISVQLPPQVSNELEDKAQKYLDAYFGETKIRVYWGTCRDFVAELKTRWEEFSRGD
jgi:hypothetical protein